MSAQDNQRSDEHPQKSALGCAAWGCPLPGAISASTRGDGSWYCRFHFFASPDDFSAITLRIKQTAPETGTMGHKISVLNQRIAADRAVDRFIRGGR